MTMTSKTPHHASGRRAFLRGGVAFAGAAVASAVCAPAEAAVNAMRVVPDEIAPPRAHGRYRESAHVRTYYDTARR